ncbi:esterase family protein [Bacillus lacus]|uniref:Esterase family protein n=1 Tax=Metabacillus lacus TaxID=1983721 RepID=A0A7X2J0Z7_9BACI|nr:esterase family protein [Metabacillus lacus]MRX73259.1 esterase family protein [Metabacillus lacus]
MSKQTGIVKEMQFYSEQLQEELTVLTYLPQSFSPLYKYSILIAQDGQDYFRLGRMARQAEALLQEKEIENIILVGVPYKDVEDRREKYHPKGSKFEAYKRFLAHELVPYLDREYPTYQMGEGRGLIGDSLAATVSLMTALDYPNIFGKVILQSPYVNDEVVDALNSLSSQPLLTVYHQIGLRETEVKLTDGRVKDFVQPNLHLKELLSQKGVTYTYEEFDGDHTWTYWQPLLKKALKDMF